MGVLLMAAGAGLYLWESGPLSQFVSPAVETTSDSGRVDERAPLYDIAATYPTETPLAGAAGRRAIETMRSFVTSTVAQFKIDGDFANVTEEDIEMMGYAEGRKQALQIGYVSATSPRTVSYIFTIYTDTLGAHGNTDFKTFTFDSETGDLLALSDLFAPGTPHLEQLARISRDRLAMSLEVPADDLMLVTGTEPSVANFRHFFLDETSLVLLFPPYAVAPYAAGPQTLAIPHVELRELRAEYK